MSLTKIGSIGINTGIAFAGVTTITTLNGSDAVLSVGGTVNFVSDVSIGGTVSIAGTLTYEDVTNVDAVGLITARNGIVVGSGITLSKDGDIFATGVTTSTTFSGSGANLTNLPAANVTGTLPAISGANLTNLTAGNLTGALPAISGANLTGIAATDNVRTGILDVAGVSTFRNTMNVGAAVTISESGIEASGIGITVANINGTQIGGRRNLVINGAMTVAQRGTPTAAASYTSGGYGACDRWRLRAISTEEADFVISQESDAPTASGFTKSLKIKTNTVESTLNAEEIFHVSQRIEAQDLQHLKYGTSSALPITLSFWVKAYQTGTYAINVYKPDSPNRQITATYTISASNTWEFKTMTFPGDTAGGGITDDTGTGLQIYWLLATGTAYTGTTSTSWANYANGGFADGQAVNIMSSTNNYFYLTGVQLEVGSQATAFEHRSFGDELSLCQRYLFKNIGESGELGCNYGKAYSSSEMFAAVRFPVAMRTTPTVTAYGNAGTSGTVHKLGSPDIAYTSIDRLDVYGGMRFNSSSAWATGDTDMYSFTFQADAEL